MLPKGTETRASLTVKPSRSRLQQHARNLPSQGKGKLTPTEARKVKEIKLPKLFVLDTNVILSDANSIFNFEEHDVYVPAIVRMELDKHKKGKDDTVRNSRAFSRTVKAILSSYTGNIREGLPLKEASKKAATGKLYLQTDDIKIDPSIAEADEKIRAVAKALAIKFSGKYQVILVTKDNNMFIEARAQDTTVQDYLNDVVIQDIDLLSSGSIALADRFWDKLPEFTSYKNGVRTRYKTPHGLTKPLLFNEFIYDNRETSLKKDLRVIGKDGDITILETLTDYSIPKNNILGITARNREQNFAANLLMDVDIDFVPLLGIAGTGKTLMALAAGIEQVKSGVYSEIIITRALISASEDIGFLPGSEREKMDPWMGALYDNLEFLAEHPQLHETKKGEKGSVVTDQALKAQAKRETEKEINDMISIKTLGFMRGRTFHGKYVIIDEAQNLTPKQVKLLVTRAGPGTKMILLGNLAQIDAPYITEVTSGLTYAVERFKGWQYSGHLILPTGERSRLANHANDVL